MNRRLPVCLTDYSAYINIADPKHDWTDALREAEKEAFRLKTYIVIPTGLYHFSRPIDFLRVPLQGHVARECVLIRNYDPPHPEDVFVHVDGRYPVTLSHLGINSGGFQGGVGLLLSVESDKSFNTDFCDFTNLIFSGLGMFWRNIYATGLGRENNSGLRDLRLLNIDSFGSSGGNILLSQVNNFEIRGLRAYGTQGLSAEIQIINSAVGTIDVTQATDISIRDSEKIRITSPVNLNITVENSSKIRSHTPSIVDDLRVFFKGY